MSQLSKDLLNFSFDPLSDALVHPQL